MKEFKTVIDTLWKIILILAIIVLPLWIVKKCSSPEDPVPEGYVLVEQASLDSLEAIANSIPDTVTVVDTTRPDTVIRWKEYTPVPAEVTESGYFYQDTVKDENLSIYVSDSISNTGIINYRKVGYKLYIPLQIDRTTTITKKVPVPVKMIEYRTIRRMEFIGVVGIGGGGNSFAVSGELDVLTKRNRVFGLQYLRTDQDWYLLKVGLRF